MLFSGGSSAAKSSKKEEKREHKADRDEKYEVQEVVFLKWADSIIDQKLSKVTDLKDVSELKFLSSFSFLILGKAVVWI
jgi:hypothetical protein